MPASFNKESFQDFADKYVGANEQTRQQLVENNQSEVEELLDPLKKKKKGQGEQVTSEETTVIYEGAESLLKRGLPLQGTGPYSLQTSGGQTMDANDFIKTLDKDLQGVIGKNTQQFEQGKGPISPPEGGAQKPSLNPEEGTCAQEQHESMSPFKMDPLNPLK